MSAAAPLFEPAAPIRRRAVHSSNVESVGHDPATGVLEVEYRGGAVYRYAGVPAQVFEDVARAPSVGAAVAQAVRGHYQHRLMPRPGQEEAAEPPPPPVPPPALRRAARVGPKPPPMEARIDPDDLEADAIRRPEERLADGTVIRGGRPCSMCGLPLGPDPDPDRAKSGLQRCPKGHVEMGQGADANRLEARGRW